MSRESCGSVDARRVNLNQSPASRCGWGCWCSIKKKERLRARSRSYLSCVRERDSDCETRKKTSEQSAARCRVVEDIARATMMRNISHTYLKLWLCSKSLLVPWNNSLVSGTAGALSPTSTEMGSEKKFKRRINGIGIHIRLPGLSLENLHLVDKCENQTKTSTSTTPVPL